MSGAVIPRKVIYFVLGMSFGMVMRRFYPDFMQSDYLIAVVVAIMLAIIVDWATDAAS